MSTSPSRFVPHTPKGGFLPFTRTSCASPNTSALIFQVTELKALTNHVVVGNVSCETKDLFAALPQTVALDINDLGTIKLSLEVTWMWVELIPSK